MKRNDLLWKAALEDLFDDFLRFFYTNADELFDIERGFEYLDKELEQLFPPDADMYAPRYVDKLVKVFTKNGNEEWVLIHIEVQSTNDQEFSKRMFQYYYRILDRYDKPITAFAIFADTAKNFHPKSYEREFLGTRIQYSYNTYKIIDQNDDELDACNNPFAMAVLSAKIAIQRKSDHQLFNLAFDLARRLINKQFSKDKIRNIMSFLKHYLRFENPEMFHKFEKEIETLTERSKTMGIEEFLLDEAKRESKEENTKDIALKMKNSGLDINLIANITGLSVEEIQKL